MGFEILPIHESQDFGMDGEPLYDVFEITADIPWKPHVHRNNGHRKDPNYVDIPPAIVTRTLSDMSKCPEIKKEEIHGRTKSSMTDKVVRLENPLLVPTYVHFAGHDVMPHDQSPCDDMYEYDDEDAPVVMNLEEEIDIMSFHPSGDSPESHVMATRTWHRAKLEDLDVEKLRPFLGWRPTRVISKTLEVTTQLARMVINYPMRRHLLPRVPWIDGPRLDEVVSTDPIFANCASLHDNYVGAQIYYGLTSRNIDIYGFKQESEFPENLEDFVRNHGAMKILRRDNAQSERSGRVTEIQRKYRIGDGFSEDYYKNQNPVENSAIRWLKHASHTLMDRHGVPDPGWFFAIKYLADVHNHCWHKSLKMTPKQKRTGITPDISAFLQFSFWEPVLYASHEKIFPSTNERPGHWVGVARNVGDALTFEIYDDQTKKIVTRSVVRPFNRNKRVQWDPAFATTQSRTTASHGGEIYPVRGANEQKLLLNGQYDAAETDGQDEQENPAVIPHLREPAYTQTPTTLKWKPSVNGDTTPIEPPDHDFHPRPGADTYTGPSRLRYSHLKLAPDDKIILPTKSGRKKSATTEKWYDVSYAPPEVDDVMCDTKTKPRPNPTERGGRTRSKTNRQAKTEPRRSDRLRKSQPPTQRENHANRRHPTRAMVVRELLGTSTTLLMGNKVVDPPNCHKSMNMNLHTLDRLVKPIKSEPRIEVLRAYHAYVRMMDGMMTQDPSDERWRVTDIVDHQDIGSKYHNKEVLVKVRYADRNNHQVWLTLDDVRLDQPIFVLTMV